jgi:two-component system NtrC family sensor kinase
MHWRLSWKLAAVVTLGIAVVHALFGYLSVGRELTEFEHEVARYHAAMGHALGAAATSTASRLGAEEALRLLDDADREAEHAEIRWLEAAETPKAQTANGWSVDEGPDHIVLTSTLPLSIAGRAGVLEIREQLTSEAAYVRGTITRIVVMTLVLVVLCYGILVAAGWVLLHRPIDALMAKVARIGAGDLSGPLLLRQRDELGTLGEALNVMCDQLSALRRSSERESDARIAALEQLRHADRLTTVGKLASGVAHELGTPLNVVAAHARMIARRQSQGEEAVQDASVIVEQTERMTGIIRQLLDFARRRKPARTREDLVSLCRQVLAMLEPLARKSSVALELSAGPPQLMAEVDAAQLQQVLTNLVMNAIQAQPGGGRVRLRVQDAPAPAAAAADSGADSDGRLGIALVVEDEGPGISDEVRERLFEPFFTTKDVGQGTGLGLPVAYGIIQEHGGRIDVASAPERGSRFTIHLPHTTA